MTLFPPSINSKRGQYFVTYNNESGIKVTDFGSTDLIYVCKSEQSEISIIGTRCMKIIMEDNKNSQISIQTNSITTGFIEIMKSQHVKVIIGAVCAHKVRTLQLDSLKDCEIVFIVESTIADTPESLNEFFSQLSIVSNIECDNITSCTQVTQLIVREGANGYITTAETKQFKDKIQQEFDRKLEQYLSNCADCQSSSQTASTHKDE